MSERELIRVAYERKKPAKEQHGRMVSPTHLPVVEISYRAFTKTPRNRWYVSAEKSPKNWIYVSAKLGINRFIRLKYITKEDEYENQKQVIAQSLKKASRYTCNASPALLSMIFTF